MEVLANIRSRDWQIGLSGVGSISEGLDDVAQCIDIILRTQKGSDPLRPAFGSNIYQYIDKPVNISIPNIKREIIEAITIWEKRVVIVSITHTLEESHIFFYITYRLVDDDLIGFLQLYLHGGLFVISPSGPGAFILEGFFPVNYQSLRLSPMLVLDGANALPRPPKYGFATPSIMFSWVVANYSHFGTWYLLSDRLICYLKNGIAASASLTILGIAVRVIEATIPRLDAGDKYQFNIAVYPPPAAGYPVDPIIDISGKIFSTLSELLTYVIANYGYLGDWAIETAGLDPGDFATSDFDDSDFATSVAVYKLVLYTYLTETIEFWVD